MKVTIGCGGRSYTKEVLMAVGAYMLVLAGVAFLIPLLPGTPLRVFVALLPALPLGLNIWVWVRHYRCLDELQQRIQLNALAVAFAGSVVFTSIYGFMQDEIDLPVMNWIWAGTFMMILWGVATIVASRRYG